jgi:DNA-directed RNA polymerase specialized sigma24 family protein
MTDEELIQAGDLATLVARYRESLVNYLTARLRDPGIADDLGQLTFVLVYCHRAKFRPGQLFRPWLYAVADRLAGRERRRVRRERRQFAEYVQLIPA